MYLDSRRMDFPILPDQNLKFLLFHLLLEKYFPVLNHDELRPANAQLQAHLQWFRRCEPNLSTMESALSAARGAFVLSVIPSRHKTHLVRIRNRKSKECWSGKVQPALSPHVRNEP